MTELFSRELLDLAGDVLRACEAAGFTLATAESCTGGLIAGCLTELPGASHVVRRGYVTYANDAKIELLGVPAALFETVGAVSEEVARAMAEGAVRASGADIAVSCTGIAGPGGATATKSIGRVHLACARAGGATTHRHADYGDIGRTEVRLATIADALRLIQAAVGA